MLIKKLMLIVLTVISTVLIGSLLGLLFDHSFSEKPRPIKINSISIKSYEITKNPSCTINNCPEPKVLLLTTTNNQSYILPLLLFMSEPFSMTKTEMSAKLINLLSQALASTDSLTLKYYAMNDSVCAYGLYKGDTPVYDFSGVYDNFRNHSFTNSDEETLVIHNACYPNI